jgi:TRAP-type C4-dicarboxylate transport system substrate-binding protein
MTMFRTTLTRALGMAAAAAMLAGAQTATAETTIRAASCFPQGSFFSKRFEAIIEKVNAAGAGKVTIEYVGGAPAIGSPFTLVQKVAQGVYDLTSCTGAYYQNVLPEADAWKLLEQTPAAIRENGGWELMTEIHRTKNLVPVARIHYGTRFHLFLGEGRKIEKPDLSGLHLRVAPIYTNFFKALGATTQNSDLAQIFTLMENGTVMGYGWPVIGHQPGWETVTKYRVDPGFYDADIQVLANAQSWDALPDEVRAMIEEAAIATETEATTGDPAMAEKAGAKQLETGFELIAFEGADRETWVTTAREAGWAGVVEGSAEYGPALRKLFAAE